jgi:hypothetical protein
MEFFIIKFFLIVFSLLDSNIISTLLSNYHEFTSLLWAKKFKTN